MEEFYKIVDDYKMEINEIIVKHEKNEELDLSTLRRDAISDAKRKLL